LAMALSILLAMTAVCCCCPAVEIFDVGR
jgi:hypothetical protein